jgi:hypothetical protein
VWVAINRKLVLGLIGVLLIAYVLFATITPVFASSEGADLEGIGNLTSLKETDRPFYYSLVGARLLQSFSTVLVQTEYGQREVIAYPPEYAGGYIDESGTLHIILTKAANMTAIKDYQAIMGNDPDVVYEYADFPLSRLYEIQRTLDGGMVKFSIESTGVNETANKLDISLLDSSQQQAIIEFLKTKFNDFDDRCVSFTGSVGVALSSAESSQTVSPESSTGFLGTTYGATAITIIAITLVLSACYLAFMGYKAQMDTVGRN